MISNYHKTTTDFIGASYRQWTEPQESPGTGTYLVSGTSFIYVFSVLVATVFKIGFTK